MSDDYSGGWDVESAPSIENDSFSGETDNYGYSDPWDMVDWEQAFANAPGFLDIEAINAYNKKMALTGVKSGFATGWGAGSVGGLPGAMVGGIIGAISGYLNADEHPQTAAAKAAADISNANPGVDPAQVQQIANQIVSDPAFQGIISQGGNVDDYTNYLIAETGNLDLSWSERQQIKYNKISPALQTKLDQAKASMGLSGNALTASANTSGTGNALAGQASTASSAAAAGTAAGGSNILEPWITGGVQSQNQLLSMINAGPGEFTESPDYQFRLGQGLQGIQRAASSMGTLRSGAHLKAANDYAQQVATQEYDNFLNRWYKSLEPYQAQSQMGQNSAVATGNWANQMAGQNAQLDYNRDAERRAYSQQQSQNWLNLGSLALKGGVNALLNLGNTNTGTSTGTNWKNWF